MDPHQRRTLMAGEYARQSRRSVDIGYPRDACSEQHGTVIGTSGGAEAGGDGSEGGDEDVSRAVAADASGKDTSKEGASEAND